MWGLDGGFFSHRNGPHIACTNTSTQHPNTTPIHTIRSDTAVRHSPHARKTDHYLFSFVVMTQRLCSRLHAWWSPTVMLLTSTWDVCVGCVCGINIVHIHIHYALHYILLYTCSTSMCVPCSPNFVHQAHHTKMHTACKPHTPSHHTKIHTTHYTSHLRPTAHCQAWSLWCIPHG